MVLCMVGEGEGQFFETVTSLGMQKEVKTNVPSVRGG